MALMQITVIPIGTQNPSVGEYVADIQRFLTEKGVSHSLGDMGTVIHGPVEELLRLAVKIHNIPFVRAAKRVITQITIDDRRDVERKIGDKKQSVVNRLQGDSVS